MTPDWLGRIIAPMPIVWPLLFLSAIAALVAGGAWFRVVRRIAKHGGEVGRYSESLSMAATATGVFLLLAAASLLAPAFARLFV